MVRERLKMGELLAAVYDPLIGPFDPLGVSEWRAWVASAARGRVLELGVGTGRNLPHYHRPEPEAAGTAAAETVAAIDSDYASLRRAFSRRNGNSSWITVYQARAEALPFGDAFFDVVLGTLVFCTIADPMRALQEVQRVLKPSGQFRLVEHVRVHNRLLAGMQDRATPLWEKIGAGCHLNRDTIAAVELAGFRIQAVQNHLGGLFVGIDATI
jgi:ubiquinone/menaquinone biosynthesis C-methylase UbiE